MTIMESIALVLLILMIAAAIAYYVQMGQLPMKDLINSTKELDKPVNKRKPASTQLHSGVVQEPTQQLDTSLNTTQKTKPSEFPIKPRQAKDHTVLEPSKPSKKKKYYPTKPKTNL